MRVLAEHRLGDLQDGGAASRWPSRLSIAWRRGAASFWPAAILRPDGLGLVQVAGADVELRQAEQALVAGGQLDELLLVLGGGLEVALLLGELGELLEELGVAGVGREQPLELGAGRAEVARGRVRLRQADRHLALLLAALRLGSRSALEPGQQAVELVALEVQLGQPA